jgi:hypothetical protein
MPFLSVLHNRGILNSYVLTVLTASLALFARPRARHIYTRPPLTRRRNQSVCDPIFLPHNSTFAPRPPYRYNEPHTADDGVG